MKSEWRANIYLARSRIQVSVKVHLFLSSDTVRIQFPVDRLNTYLCSQGLGLFAARDIEKQTMVIEYNGTILRNEVAIRKEKNYRTQVFICFLHLHLKELLLSEGTFAKMKSSKVNSPLSLPDRTEKCSCSASTANML